MNCPEVHQCTCVLCQSPGTHPEQADHRRMNLVLSRLNEAQRRWYAAAESLRWGRGGIQRVAQITGLDPHTIRRGRQDLAHDLRDLPAGRLRHPGAGRPRLEKKLPPWKPT